MFTLSILSWHDVAAILTLKMGYIEINRVVCNTRHNMAQYILESHNDKTPEIAPAPIAIISLHQLSNIGKYLTSPQEGL